MRPNPERAPTFLIYIYFFLWNNGLVESQMNYKEVGFVSLSRYLQTKLSGPWMDPGLREGTWECAKSRKSLGTKLEWLGVFSKFPFPFEVSTPFQTLQDWVNNSAHDLRKNYLEIEPSVLEMQTCKEHDQSEVSVSLTESHFKGYETSLKWGGQLSWWGLPGKAFVTTYWLPKWQ